MNPLQYKVHVTREALALAHDPSDEARRAQEKILERVRELIAPDGEVGRAAIDLEQDVEVVLTASIRLAPPR